MSVQRYTVLACDCCGEEGVFQGRDAQEVRTAQRRIGWVTALAGGKDKCRKCELHAEPCET